MTLRILPILLTLSLLLPSLSLAGTRGVGGKTGGATVPTYTFATLPSSGVQGDLALMTDGDTDSDCTTGSGDPAFQVLCFWTGSVWAPTGDSGAGSGDSIKVDATTDAVNPNFADTDRIDVNIAANVITWDLKTSSVTSTYILDDTIGTEDLNDTNAAVAGDIVHVTNDGGTTQFEYFDAGEHRSQVGVPQISGTNTWNNTQSGGSWSITDAGVGKFISLDDNDGSPLWGINTAGEITAVKFGGIASANLMDLAVGETITGRFNFATADGIIIPFGTLAELPSTPSEGTMFMVNNGGDATDCDPSGTGTFDVLCIWDAGAGPAAWRAVASGGATAWDSIGSPSGDGSVSFAELDQDLIWNTAAAVVAFDGMTFQLLFDATSDSSSQNLVKIVQVNGGGDATGQPEALLLIENLDTTTDDAALAAIEIRATGTNAVIPIAIDISDPEIAIGISIGSNTIKYGASSGSISSTDFDIIDDGTVDGGSGGDIGDNTITQHDLAANIVFDNGDLLDFAGLTMDSSTEGIILPQIGSACVAMTAEGQICWDTVGDDLYVGTNGGVQQINASGVGAFADTTPVLLNSTGKDVVVGAAQKNTSKLTVDGDADQVQLTIQGHSDQSTAPNLLVVENSAGTDKLTLDNDGLLNVVSLGDVDGSAFSISTTGAIVALSFTTGSSTTPTISFDDQDARDGTPNAQIIAQSVGETDNTDMSFRVDSGPSSLLQEVILIDTNSDVTTIQLGQPGSHYVSISEVGEMTFSGASSDITLPALSVDAGTYAANSIDADDLNHIMTIPDEFIIDMSAINVNDGSEGLILPKGGSSCTGATADGQICWDEVGKSLYVGDGTGGPTQMASGSGDVTDVLGCAGADCSNITTGATTILDFSANDSTTGMLVIPQVASACAGATTVGEICWDSANNDLYVGDGVGGPALMNGAAPATELRSMYWGAGAMNSDGSNCANPTEVTINSGPKMYTIICGDSDSSVMHGSAIMPDGWDAGTVTFEVNYLQTAADTAALDLEIVAQCRNATTVINSTYGTEIEIDDDNVTGSNAIDATTSTAVTANGTCAAGDFLAWQLSVDAGGTATAMTTLHFLGVKMEYTSTIGD